MTGSLRAVVLATVALLAGGVVTDAAGFERFQIQRPDRGAYSATTGLRMAFNSGWVGDSGGYRPVGVAFETVGSDRPRPRD